MEEKQLKKWMDKVDNEIGNLHENIRNINDRTGGDQVILGELENLKRKVDELEGIVEKIQK